MTKAKLLDDDEELDFQPSIQVNEEYAKRFEYNKRREELHRLQEKHPEVAARLARQAALGAAKAARQGAGKDAAADAESEEEESSSDDEDDEELLENDDTDKVLETLVRIKKKDPVVFQKDAVLFPEPEDDEADAADGAAAGKDSKGSKKMYLRTVLAQQALEGGGAAASSDDESGGDDDDVPRQPVSQSYAAEQQELKKAFLEAAAEAEQDLEEEKGILKAKRRAAVADGKDGDAGKEQQVNQLLDEYFGKDEELNAADAFLKSYLANRAWKAPADGAAAAGSSRKRLRGTDGDSSSSSSGDDDDDDDDDSEGGQGADDDEDEQFLETVDRFEAAYNFRYEEPGSTKIQSFPRVIEDSVRRPDERRKRQRQAKAERQAAERDAREAELRRLKNLKKEEINDKLARIQEEAGLKAKAPAAAGKAAASGKLASLMDELLEGDFDPEEYDRRMAEAFDDEYYEEAEESHELFGDAEEELADEADVEAGTDPDAAAAGFAALRQKLKQQQGDQEDADDGEGAAGADDKAAKTAALAAQRSQLQRLLEDYYKLDYEDNIGGLPCRFKYREVAAESFGLTDDDILTLSDKQLNQIAGLRLIAPYREDAKRLRPNYKALQTIKGEAAEKAALRQQKKDREKLKEKQKKQQAKQQVKGQQQQQDEQQQVGQPQRKLQHGSAGKQQQQQFNKHKQRFQLNGRQQHSQQQHRHKQQQQQQQQQQKPLAEMTADEKQAARLASYAKLTLKPSKEAQQQQEAAAAAAGDRHKSKKRKAEQQGEGGADNKKQPQAQQPGRLANVQVDAPLTKAQRKNMLRTLKRKEKQQQQRTPA